MSLASRHSNTSRTISAQVPLVRKSSVSTTMAARRSAGQLLDLATPSTQSRILLRTAPRPCTCRYTTEAAPFNHTSTSSRESDIRSQIAEASLPFIPEYGFTLAAVKAGLSALRSSSPSSRTFASSETTSPLFLDQLFPVDPPHKRHSLRPSKVKQALDKRDIFKSAETPFPMDDVNAHLEQEENGPRRALFKAWAEAALKELESTTKAIEAAQGTSGSKKTVLELLQKRLEYNVPVLNHLPTALGTLARLDTVQPSLFTFKPYLSHVGGIAKQIKALSGSNISTARLATVYSLSEFYQLSPKSKPDIVSVLNYTNDLLRDTAKYDGLIKESVGFAGYVVQSWKNLLHARGM